MVIDTMFDFLSETPPGKDADAVSPTLKRYHRLLWSKPLPSGPVLALEERPGHYLVHDAGGELHTLGSDAITTNLLGKAARVISQIPHGNLPPDLGYTIGSSILFPAQRIGRRMTINGARGFHPRIADRFDLTLECIRRHYAGGHSPLSAVLARYADFFDLFDDFAGYVDFFLLDDLIDGARVRFFRPFDDFQGPAVPQDVAGYLEYRHASDEFIRARNRRIDHYVASADYMTVLPSPESCSRAPLV